jgi:peptide-methionine (S)-S-oxide reductase
MEWTNEMTRPLILVAAIIALALLFGMRVGGQPVKQRSDKMEPLPPGLETATLGGGCFWCVEAVFADFQGVHKVESGYAGGKTDNPTYKEVCSGTTGHAEVIQVHFDPKVISYDEILNVFFHAHDPTTLNRQGGDVGTQYRSVIFYDSEAQRKTAEAAMEKAAKLWSDPIVTEISPLPKYFPAEDYHQDYFALNGSQPYCRMVIAPKLQKIRKEFAHRLKSAEAGQK